MSLRRSAHHESEKGSRTVHSSGSGTPSADALCMCIPLLRLHYNILTSHYHMLRVWSASHEPFKRLFSSIILVDPIIAGTLPTNPDGDKFIGGMMTGALSRRDHWSSREEALRLFKSSPFFQRWDPTTLDVYIECGLYEDPNGGFRLKMAPIHVRSFCRHL